MRNTENNINCYKHKDRKAEVYIVVSKIIYMCCKSCAKEFQIKIKDKDEKEK